MIRERGEIIASIALSETDAGVWLDGEPAIYINRLIVDPKRQGSGIGNAGMGFAERVAREKHKPLLRLSCVPSDSLVEWYRRLGFVDRGEVKLPEWNRSNLRFEKLLS